MKTTQIDNNTLSIKISLGRIDIKDNMEGPNGEKVVAISLNPPHDVKIEGLKEEITCPYCSKEVHIDKRIGKFILLKRGK